MADKSEKKALPPYVSYKSFIHFIKGLRDTHLPSQIDRSIMPKQSGAQQSSMISALRFLGMIDENDRPTSVMKDLVAADEKRQKEVLKIALETAYSFLFKDGEFQLETATGQQLAEKFRGQEISGSTVTKSIGFFLAAAKEVGIKYSIHIKAPQPVRNGSKRTARRRDAGAEYEEEQFEEEVSEEMERFQIPIPGKASATITIPKDLEPEDWNMLETMFKAYIARLQASQKK